MSMPQESQTRPFGSPADLDQPDGTSRRGESAALAPAEESAFLSWSDLFGER